MKFTAAPWLTLAFYQRVQIACIRDQVVDPIGLLGTWMSESGLRPDVINHHGGATGLFQAMPSTLQNLHVSGGSEAFAKYTAVEQAAVAEAYYAAYKGKLRSAALCYLATFLPAYLLGDVSKLTGDKVLTSKTGPLPWAYAANTVFDTNGDYAITLGELAAAIVRNAHGPVWEEASANLAETMGLAPPLPAPLPAPYDLRTTRGIQQALAQLGRAQVAVDGIPGKMTRAAIVAWQQTHALQVDGIPGPLTRASLRAALIAAGCTPGS